MPNPFDPVKKPSTLDSTDNQAASASPDSEVAQDTDSKATETKKKAATEKKRDNSVKFVDKPSMAQEGRKIDFNAPPAPLPPLPTQYSSEDHYIPDEMDFTDLTELNRAINKTRIRAFRIKNEITNAQRRKLEVSDRYRKAYGRAYVTLSGGTAEQRKHVAEIQVEDIYSEMIIANHVVEELKSLSYVISNDLGVLKTISDNLRKQLSL